MAAPPTPEPLIIKKGQYTMGRVYDLPADPPPRPGVAARGHCIGCGKRLQVGEDALFMSTFAICCRCLRLALEGGLAYNRTTDKAVEDKNGERD